MPKSVCSENSCSACGACLNICPKNCIEFVEDNLDQLRPVIDENICINCNLCKKVCPQVNPPPLKTPLNCYAAYIKNSAARLDSASGGIARAFYEYCLENIKGAKIAGVHFNDDFGAEFLLTEEKDDISGFQGSKYVQADTGGIYKQIALELQKGAFILFAGMPCQSAALKNYLEAKKINQDNLLVVDILCHGAAPQAYLNQTLSYIKQKFNLTSMEKPSFRSNRKYRNFHFYIRGKNKNGREIIYNKYAYEEPYFFGFLKGITLRESCYKCGYSRKERIGDITIGDFLGLGQCNCSPHFEESPVNLSMILCNTPKGLEFVSELKRKDKIKLFERPLEEAVEGGASLQKPFPRHKLRNDFIKHYKKGEFISVMKKIAFWELFFYPFKVLHKKLYVHLFMRDLLK